MAVSCANKYDSLSAVLSPGDLEQVEKLCEVSRVYLRQVAEDFVRSRSAVPVLLQYGNDSTPVQTVETYRCESAGFSKVFYRRGRGGKDFLAEKLFVTDGETVCVVFTDPQELVDKTAATAFEASRRLFGLPAQLGHNSISILAHVYDRALFDAMVKLQRQRAEAVHLQETIRQEWSAGYANLMSLLCWFVCTPCINHAVHNGLKWSVNNFINDKTCMRSAYIAVSALRTSFTTLAEFVEPWVVDRIEFEDCESQECTRQLWEILVHDLELRAELNNLQIRFSGGRLRVARRFRGSPNVVSDVVTLFLRLWQFSNFCESRWCTLGPVARTMVTCFILGMFDLVSFIIAIKRAKKLYLLSFLTHCTKQVSNLFGVVSVGSHVADAVLFLLLQDDRVVAQLDAIDDLMQDRLDMVQNILPNTWYIIGEATQISQKSLCDQSTAASLAAVAHIQEALLAARRPPWDLAKGDVDENLTTLDKLRDEPAEEVTCKVWKLLKLGWSRDELKQGLTLLRQVHWSSTPVEQAHSGSHHAMRRRKQYRGRTMRARVMLHMMRGLVVYDVKDKARRRLTAQLQRLRRWQPNRITGRHVFLERASAKLRAKSVARASRHPMQLSLMKQHAKSWGAMSPAEQSQFEAGVSEMREKKDRARDVTRKRLVASITKLTDERQGVLKSDVRLRMSSCRLNSQQRDEIDKLWSSGLFTSARVAELRDQHIRPIGPPPEPMQRVLSSMELWPPLPRPARPGWLALLCWHRDWVKGAVLRLETMFGTVYAKLLHALQSPLLVVLAVLEKVKSTGVELTPANWGASVGDAWKHEFVLKKRSYLFSSAGDLHATWPPPQFLHGALFLPRGRVVADGEWVSFNEVKDLLGAAGLPDETAPLSSCHDTATTPEAAPSWREDDLLEDFFETGGPQLLAPQQLGNNEVDAAAFEALDEACTDEIEVTESSEASRSNLFKYSHSSGQYASWNDGNRYELLKIEAVPPISEWLAARWMVRSQSFGVELFEFSDIMVMVEFWCHKQTWLYMQAESSGPGGELFGPLALECYVEPPEVHRAYRTANDACRLRIDKIRDIAPRKPPS